MLCGTAEVSIDSLFPPQGGDLDRRYPRASPLVAKAVRGPFLISDELVSFPPLFSCHFHVFVMLFSHRSFSLSLSLSLLSTVFSSSLVT